MSVFTAMFIFLPILFEPVNSAKVKQGLLALVVSPNDSFHILSSID